ncbi:hypothetical protein TSA66_01015 [Noviherbaspirillum autotrophicum]|uniref:Uncharacterized protein n=1 Tax=Noviherbaspirillum autotrophicum TaxID=709839 RepID=A0A0C2BHX6_9BURK|nr:hypothetical protein TSA66_08080 [Noviherbaspirillum autotrophicum]KIF80825.1 hypothetical protein TSA66_08325 [Noviherbaspirillum autotrophicum]KIF84050.1 hypothetical protein TSA66_01015 [Noviherbaspirillum autotrophicum]
MTCKYSEINQHDALYKIARSFKGGIESVAQRMGKTVPVMYNKLRPGIMTHHMTFEEATEVIELCIDAGVPDALLPAQAFAWRLGQVLVPVPSLDNVRDEDLTQTVCRAMKEFGDVASGIYDALNNDGKIKSDELEKLEKEFREAIGAMTELRARVRARAGNDAEA